MRAKAPLLLAVACAIATGAKPAAAQPTGSEQRGARLGSDVQSALAPFEGRELAAITLRCDIPRCEEPDTYARLLRLTTLRAGRPLEVEAVRRAWSRLLQTGYFRSVAPRVESMSGGKVALVFDATGHVVVTDIDIRYATWSSRLYPAQFDTEIRKRLLVRKGGHLPTGDPGNLADPDYLAFVERQERAIVELYKRQGYRGTTVRIETRFHGLNQKRADVTVTVDEGQQPDFGEVLLRGNQAFGYARVVAPITTGERADFGAGMFELVGIGRYEKRRLKEELAEVERRYRLEGWYEARVRLVAEVERRGLVHPIIEVREGRHVTVAFEGNRTLDDEDLEAVLTFAETGAFDEAEIESSAEEIRAAYQAAGHYFAEVTSTVTTVAPKRVQLTFTVEEGPIVHVRFLRFEGNRLLRASALREAMELAQVGASEVVGPASAAASILQDAQMVNDLTAVRALYRDQGFPAIRFRCTPVGDDAPKAGGLDVWSSEPALGRCFRVERTHDPALIDVVVGLHEGPRTTARRIELNWFLDNLERTDTAAADQAREILRGLGFMNELYEWRREVGINVRKLESVQGLILRSYHQRGYLKASVRPDCSDPKHPERRCTEADLYGASLERVRFLVTPGRATRVDGILLKGNLVTQPGEIKNELLFDEGEPLGTDDLFRSQSNLRSLGIFEAVKIETITTEGGGDEEPAGVVVTVEEGDSILLDTGVGLRIDSEPLSTTDLPVLYVLQSSIRDTNFLGHALELGLGAEHANRIDTPTDTAGDDATWLVGPFLRNRRFLRTKLDLRLELTYSLGRTLARDQYREAYTAEAVLGYDFYHMSWPRSWGRGLLWTMSVEYSRERRRGLTSAGERPVFGDPVNALAIRPGIRLDKRDNALHPTRGYSVELASEVVFNSDELAGLANPSFKETLIGQYVTSFLDRRLILAGSLGAGAVQTDLAEEDLPADFLFKAGGDAVALPVRGYPDASIEASGVRALEAGEVFTSVGGEAMTIGSFEARFPTFVLDDWWFAFFADVGAVAPTWPDMTPDRIFPSVGGGIRWLLLSQIPIRLDLGIPLRATAQSDRLDPRLHLNIFYTF